MERDELAGWLRLALTPGAGNETCRKLLASFGLPSAIFSQPQEALKQVVSPALARSLCIEPEGFARQLDVTCQWVRDAPPGQRRVMTLADPDYPPCLLAMNDPPPMLYLMGAIHLMPDPLRSIAIVGSRNPTPQGEVNAREFGKALSAAGLTVVSGMALGVDGAAHEGALMGALQGIDAASAQRLSTIAVIGTGLDRVYPKRHLALAHRIAGSGLIISEFPLGTPPLDHNFPKRNRIIAALAQGTLVVEAALRSGSLITARLALEQGKDVFAIPGSIHSPLSRGCHLLIRQGAKLVESAQDVLEELRLPDSGSATPVALGLNDTAANDDAPGREHALLKSLGFDPVSLDALVARTGMEPANLLAQLLELELGGHVARLPGGLYQRLAHA
jgi:DNA processing protein